ncbi:MAG: tetratricopeptide repeat protein [Nitrospirota bacterium]
MHKKSVLSLSVFAVVLFLLSCTTDKVGTSYFDDPVLIVTSKPAATEEAPQAETVEEPDPVEDDNEFQQVEVIVEEEDAEDYYNLGVTLEKTGRYEEAAKAYRQAILMRPDYTEAYYNLGISLDDAGKYVEAIEAYKQVVKLKPDYEDTYYKLGVSFEITKKYREAIEAYTQMLSIRPDHTEALYNLGLSHLTFNNKTSALAEYKSLQRLAPGMADDLYGKALEMAGSDKSTRYMLQLGAYKNINFANRLLKKLKEHYLNAHIERENNFSKVRITGIKTDEELDLIKEDLKKRLKMHPYVIKLR